MKSNPKHNRVFHKSWQSDFKIYTEKLNLRIAKAFLEEKNSEEKKLLESQRN